MKIGYQLKQVRERLAKGLVDKGILRTEKRNFLLFDMATHPVADGGAKEEIRKRVRNVLTQRTVVLPGSQFLPENLEFRYIRTIALVCAAYAANVLENALATLGHESRERAFTQVDELLAEYSQWPFGKRAGGASGGIGANLGQVISEEVSNGKDKELQLEASLFIISTTFDYTNNPIGRSSMSQRLHKIRFFAVVSSFDVTEERTNEGKQDYGRGINFYIVVTRINSSPNTRVQFAKISLAQRRRFTLLGVFLLLLLC